MQLPGYTKVSSLKATPLKKTRKGRGRGEILKQLGDGKVGIAPTKEKACSITETLKTFCVRFVRLSGILFTRTSLETFDGVFSMVGNDLRSLLSSGPEEELNFGSDAANNCLFIVRLVTVIMFTVHNVKESEGQTHSEILQRSVLLHNAFTAAFEIVARIVGRCEQLCDPSSSFLLPGILVFVEWLACHLEIAVGRDEEDREAAARSLFWKQCITLFNKLMSSELVSTAVDEDENSFFNMSKYDGETENRLALWEDFELRGFIPLVPAQLILEFSRQQSTVCDGRKEKRARVQRILAAGRALLNVVQVDKQGVYFDQKSKKFVIGGEPEMSQDFVLKSSDMTMIYVTTQEKQVEKIRNVGVEQKIEQIHPEVEEEDEEIVFKPTMVKKLVDVIPPKLTTYNVFEPSENASKAEEPVCSGSLSAPVTSVCVQDSLDAPQPLPQSSSGALSWHVDDYAYLARMKNLTVADNGEGFVPFYPPVSNTCAQSTNNIAGSFLNGYSGGPAAVDPSNFDLNVPSGAIADDMVTSSSPASSKRNPVSRPIRHVGPPPGFSPVRTKPIETVFELKNETLPLDDYSWLDGYQLSSSTKGTTPSSTNTISHAYPHVTTNSNGFTDARSFPFPGKLDRVMQVSTENWKSGQLFGQLKRYQEQQQQLQQANQEYTLQQGNREELMWSGSSFV